MKTSQWIETLPRDRRSQDASYRRATMSGRAGFTLVEVLVAFTILALVMVVVQRGVLTAVGGTERADRRIAAEMVARTLMTAPLGDGAASSGQLNGYDWTIRLEQINLPFATNVTTDGKAPEWIPQRMIIKVLDRRGGLAAVTTETIRLVKAATR